MPAEVAQLAAGPGLGEAGIGTAGGTTPLLQTAHGTGDLQACRHLEAPTPHLGRGGNREAQTGVTAPRGRPTPSPSVHPFSPLPPQPPPPRYNRLTVKAGSRGCVNLALKVCRSCLVRAL